MMYANMREGKGRNGQERKGREEKGGRRRGEGGEPLTNLSILTILKGSPLVLLPAAAAG